MGASRASTAERLLTRKDDSTSHNVAAGVTADSHPPPVVNSPITTNPTEPTVHLTRFRVYASPVHTLSHHVRFAPLSHEAVSVSTTYSTAGTRCLSQQHACRRGMTSNCASTCPFTSPPERDDIRLRIDVPIHLAPLGLSALNSRISPSLDTRP